jgi:Predicted membrane protein (DUF2142)
MASSTGRGLSVGSPAAWTGYLLDPRKIAILYFVLATMATMIMTAILPPFAAPDEFAQFFRAESLSSGQILPVLGPDRLIGGAIDPAALKVFLILGSDAGEAAPAPTGKIAAIRDLRWEGTGVFMTFPNTGQYGPAFYGPHALGLFVGRSLGLSVLHSYDLARVLGALASVAVAALAIGLAGRGAFAAAIVLSSPIFLFLASSVTQDGPMIAVAALFAACAIRSRRAATPGPGRIAWLCVLALGMGRPPYALLAVLLLRGRSGRSWACWLGAADGPLAPLLVCGLVLGWLGAIGAPQQANFANVPGVAPAAQLDGLRRDPAAVLSIAQGTLDHDEFARMTDESIGVLGTLNIRLPDADYDRGTAALLLAAATCLLLLPAPGLLFNAATALVFALIIGEIYAALYLTWTPLGSAFVSGAQGRYFVPLLAGAPMLLPSLVPPSWGMRPWPTALRAGLAALAGLSGWGLMIMATVSALSCLSRAYGPLLAGGWWQ